MSITVQHDKRRREILERALDVFVDSGYEDTTFQKIADRSGITRTTLYIYFRNKKEIFNWSIKQMMEEIEKDLELVKDDTTLNAPAKLKRFLTIIIQHLEEHSRLLHVVLNYLLHLSKSGSKPDTRVKRRTVRLRHLLAGIVIEGIDNGELPAVSVRSINDLLYSFIDSCIYRLVVLHQDSIKDILPSIEFAVDAIAQGAPNSKA